MDEHFGTAMGVVGLNYSKALGFNSFIKVTLAASREHQTNHQDKVVRHIENVLKQTYVSGAEPPIQETYQLGFLPIFYYKIDF